MSTENTESSQPTPATEAAAEAAAQQEDAALRAEAAQTLARHEEQARTMENPALAELAAEAAQRMQAAQLAATKAAADRAEELRSAAAEAEAAAGKLADAAEKLEDAQPSMLGTLAQGALWGLGLLGTAFVVAKVVGALTRQDPPPAPRERGAEEAKYEGPERSTTAEPEPAPS